MTQLSDFAPTTIAGQAARLQPAQRFFNLVVTNVPGPQFPLYLMGRRLLAIYPMVPLARRQAVCFGIMSYDGQVNFGLTGDYDAMRDLDSLAGDLEDSIDELAKAAKQESKPKRRSRSKSTRARAGDRAHRRLSALPSAPLTRPGGEVCSARQGKGRNSDEQLTQAATRRAPAGTRFRRQPLPCSGHAWIASRSARAWRGRASARSATATACC